MKLKSIYFIFFAVFSLSFVSCLNSDEEDLENARSPYFVSLTFLANDSIEGLDKAVFTLEYDEILDDSIIVNLDSLPFDTRIDSVWPVFYFRSTSTRILYQEWEHGIDTTYLVGNSSSSINDTIDFTALSTKIQNFSADGTAERTYNVKVNVHQVEPELYVWKKLNPEIIASPDINQKAILFKNKYLFYVGSEMGKSLYYTDKAGLENTWANGQLVFPAENTTSIKFRYMTEHISKTTDPATEDTLLFVTDNANKLYFSNNGESWEEISDSPADFEIYNLLFSVNNKLWAIGKQNNTYHIVSSETGKKEWVIESALKENFPVDDYAALVFKSPVGRPKMLIVGGYNAAGALRQANWSSADGIEWFALRDNSMGPIHNAALAQYDNKLLLFGGMSDGNIIPLQESLYEGLSWNTPDSASNMLPKDFPVRSYQSVIVDEADKRIFLIGGKDSQKTYSDVWTAKLNRLYWED